MREFERHSKQTKWNKKTLLVQYYKRFKNKFKNEISQKDKSDINKKLIKLVYNIDNQFYIRNFKRKENYNPNDKCINNWYKYNKKTENQNSDVIEIDVIKLGKISKQIRIKYIENKIYFNYSKTSYIVRSCQNGKRQQRRSDSKMQITATKQRVYNITDLDKKPILKKLIQKQNTHFKYQKQMQLHITK